MASDGQEEWLKEDVRRVIRMLACAGAAPGGIEGRRMVLLEAVARMMTAEGWVLLSRNGGRLAGGRAHADGDQTLEWEGPAFRLEAFRSGVAFPDHAKRLTALVLKHCTWLGEEGRLEGKRDLTEPRATLRQAQVLAGMLAGDARKEIAAKLGISVNTVSDHVKELYRIHGVRSQAMLVNKIALDCRVPRS